MKKPSKRFVILSIIVAAIALCSLAWSTAYPSGTWRYKITVNVDTPEGVKSGSVVRGVYATQQSKIANVAATASSYGEAVVVDLGERGVLFGILRQDDGYHVVFKAFPGPGGLTKEGIEYYSKLKAKTVLKPDNYPMFVRFKKLDDPKSVMAVLQNHDAVTEKVYGPESVETFEEAFGEGVSLKEITLEMTDEPATKGIVEKHLTWLKEKRGLLDGRKYTDSKALSNVLDTGCFKTGRY